MLHNESSRTQAEGLATLLVLNDEVKKLVTLREFGFFVTNETHRLIVYHTAYLWHSRELMGVEIVAQSGTPETDNNSPVNIWLKEVIEFFCASENAKKIHQVNVQHDTPNTLSESEKKSYGLPEYILWCPLLNKRQELNGGLILMRETPFSEAEIKMLHWLIASYQYTWQVLVKSQIKPLWEKIITKTRYRWLILLAVAVLFFPIHLSVLGMGTVIPRSPELIVAPMQGVIESFSVKSGDFVQPGQVLVTLDKTDLQANLEVDKKNYMLTEAKLRAAINSGFNNNESRADIPILQAALDIDKAHLDYTRALLNKTNITSTTSGIVIIDNKEDWIGQPVQTGERILIVADPNQVKLKINISISDMIKLEVGAKGNFYLQGQLISIPIRLETLGYNAKLLPNKILAYELTADFTNSKDKPQLGAQGSVRLYGHRVPLIYYLIRRPLQAMRQAWGI